MLGGRAVLLAYYDILPFSAPTPLLAGLCLLLGAWGDPKGKGRQGKKFLNLLCTSLDSSPSSPIKRRSAIFWPGGMLDKS